MTNRVLPLLYAAVRDRADVPAALVQSLRLESQRSFVATSLTAQPLRFIAAALEDIPWVLLRGPVLGQLIYGDLMLRPYGDLDVLVDPDRIDEALQALGAAGFLPPPSALPERYYRRYHLHVHLMRAGLAGKTAVELHWALDHPFTLLTPDISGMLRRRECSTINGQEVPHLALDDLLIALAIHAVKHAAPLHYWVNEGIQTALAEHGMLLHFFDIALAIQRFGPQLDWATIRQRSATWGAGEMVDLCLRGIRLVWPESAPDGLITGALRPVTWWERSAYRLNAQGEERGAFKQLRGFFFRPIRLLDSIRYLHPPAEYLRRRYLAATMRTRFGHSVRGLAALIGGGVALIYYQALWMPLLRLKARRWKDAGK